MSKATEKRFLALANQKLPIAHSAVWLGCIIDRHFLVGFDLAPGLIIVAREDSTPRELATLLAIRQIEADAFASFSAGFQAQAERAQFGGQLQ